MTIKLDASHQPILEHWETLEQMKKCGEEVEDHLKAVAKRSCGAIYSQHKDRFVQEDGLNKEGRYFNFVPKLVQDSKKFPPDFLCLGIEGVSVGGILPSRSAPCACYVWSYFRYQNEDDNSTDKLESIVEPPSGFLRSLDIPDRGYIFRKVLPSLAPKDFLDPSTLGQYITDPLETLVKWWTANEGTILKAVDLSRRKKSPR